MHKIIILTVGKWRFAVREEDLSMISSYDKKPMEKWQNKVLTADIKDIKVINETNDNRFSNFIYFTENNRTFCLGVDSICYPSEESMEDHFYFSQGGESDGIIGSCTNNEDFISIVNLGKFLEKWLGMKSFMN